jgi:hypothetical protein
MKPCFELTQMTEIDTFLLLTLDVPSKRAVNMRDGSIITIKILAARNAAVLLPSNAVLTAKTASRVNIQKEEKARRQNCLRLFHSPSC